MNKLLPQIIFGFAMVALGIMVLFFEKGICSVALRLIGQKKGLFSTMGSAQITWSIRSGGIIAILIGVFVLWMSWRIIDSGGGG